MPRQHLILGASGLIGQGLLKTLRSRAAGTYFNTTKPGLCIFNALTDDLNELLERTGEPEIAVLLLSQSNIDQCARDPQGSAALNIEVTKQLITEFQARRIRVVYVSTDTVFDGESGGYTEVDQLKPILTYGRQKAEIEHYLSDNAPDSIIVRLPKVIGHNLADGSIFATWVADLAQRKPIRLATDQFQSVIALDDAVEAICLLIEREASGIYHVGGPEKWSRASLFQAFLKLYAQGRSIASFAEHCSIDDFEFIERRPKDTSLDSSKIKREFGFEAGSVLDACQRMIAGA